MKRFVCVLLTLVMLLGLFPMTAINANAASKLTTSSRAINVLKEYEGFEKDPYQVGSLVYIGYGSLLEGKSLDQAKAMYPNGISKEDAATLLKEHVSDIVDDAINAFTKDINRDLTQYQHDALALFSYSYGTAWMDRNSGEPLRKAVVDKVTGNEFINIIGQYHGAALPVENKYFNGLMNRRLSEANMYLNDSYAYEAPKSYTYTILDKNGNETVDSGDEVVAYDYNKGYALAKLADTASGAFQGWYLYDGKADGNVTVTTQAITKLNSKTAGKTVVAKFSSGETAVKYEINSNSLVSRNVFPKAYTQSEYKANISESKIGTLAKDVKFKVTAEAMVDGVKWLKGSGKDSKDKSLTGWVYMGELPEPGTSTAKPVATATVTAATLNIREGATVGSKDLGDLTKGTTVNIYEIKIEATATGNQKWGKVDFTDAVGKRIIGWINLANTDLKETAGKDDSAAGRKGKIINAGEVNVRDNPGLNYTNVLTKLKKGTEVTILETRDLGTAQWGLVKWSGLKDGYTQGWVYMYYVEAKGLEHTTPSGTGSSNEKILYTGVVTSNINLNVRKSADIYADLTGKTLPRGTKINIYDTKTSRNMKWGKIGSKQWVCLAYVDLTKVDNSTAGGTGATSTTILQATVTAASLDMYQNYNSNSAKVGSLKKGDVLTVLERNTETTETGTRIWGRVIKGGVEGWINLAYVELKTVTSVTGGTSTGGTSSGSGSSNAGGADGMVTNCITLNVRAGAGVHEDRIAGLPNGTAVKVYDRITYDGAPWARITWNGGQNEGWACMNYIIMSATGGNLNTNGSTVPGTNSNTISATGVVNSNINLRVRAGAGIHHQEVGSLAKGTRVTIYEQVTENGAIWGCISYNNVPAWICLTYVTVDNVSYTGKGVMGTIARCAVAVNVRSAPGTDNAKVGTIEVGKRVEVFETKYHGTALWVRVAQGWISGDYVLMDSQLPPGTSLDASQPTEAPTQPSVPQETINRDNEVLYTITANFTGTLDVLNNADQNSDVIGTVKQNASNTMALNILAVKNNGPELFGRIDQYATAGWVDMAKVTYEVNGFINTDDQPVYADPDTTSTVKGTLNINTPAKIVKLNADTETVYGWFENSSVAGWVPMGRISSKETEVLVTYKSSLDSWGVGHEVSGTTNASITAYNEANGSEEKFYLNSGVTVYIEQIDLEYGKVWGRVTANGTEAWINLAAVTYTINATTTTELNVRKDKVITDDSKPEETNVLGVIANSAPISVCELSFDNGGKLWGKVKGNADANLNGGYVSMEYVSTTISIEYK